MAQFFVCGADLIGTTGNPFSVLKNAITFNACGLPDWVSVVLFMVLTLPALLAIAGYVFQMFGSEIGAAVAILLGLVSGAIAVFA